MHHENAGLDFDKAFVNFNSASGTPRRIHSLSNVISLNNLNVRQPPPKPLGPNVTYNTPPSACMDQNDVLPPNEISNFFEVAEQNLFLELDTVTPAATVAATQDASLISSSTLQATPVDQGASNLHTAAPQTAPVAGDSSTVSNAAPGDSAVSDSSLLQTANPQVAPAGHENRFIPTATPQACLNMALQAAQAAYDKTLGITGSQESALINALMAFHDSYMSNAGQVPSNAYGSLPRSTFAPQTVLQAALYAAHVAYCKSYSDEDPPEVSLRQAKLAFDSSFMSTAVPQVAQAGYDNNQLASSLDPQMVPITYSNNHHQIASNADPQVVPVPHNNHFASNIDPQLVSIAYNNNQNASNADPQVVPLPYSNNNQFAYNAGPQMAPIAYSNNNQFETNTDPEVVPVSYSNDNQFAFSVDPQMVPIAYNNNQLAPTTGYQVVPAAQDTTLPSNAASEVAPVSHGTSLTSPGFTQATSVNPHPGVDLNSVSRANQPNPATAVPVTQVGSVNFNHPQTGFNNGNIASANPETVPRRSMLFTMETCGKRLPKPKPKRTPRKKQNDVLHGNVQKKQAPKTPRKAKRKQSEAPVTPLRKIISTVPPTPLSKLAGAATPNMSTPSKVAASPVTPMTPMTKMNGKSESNASVNPPDMLKQFEDIENDIRSDWKSIHEHQLFLQKQQPPNDPQTRRLWNQQMDLNYQQRVLCNQKTMKHMDQKRQFMLVQQNWQKFQTASQPGIYPTPPKERSQSTLYQPQQAVAAATQRAQQQTRQMQNVFAAPTMEPVSSSSSLGSTSSDKRNFEFVENVTPPNFVANPNNHARWGVGPTGDRTYLNGSPTKKARIARK